MPTKTWKSAERKIAQLLSGKRVGCTGESTPDVVTPWLVVEVKQRKRGVPTWLADALDQARRHADDEHLGVAIVHRTGDRYLDSFVVVRLDDFVAWFGPGKED